MHTHKSTFSHDTKAGAGTDLADLFVRMKKIKDNLSGMSINILTKIYREKLLDGLDKEINAIKVKKFLDRFEHLQGVQKRYTKNKAETLEATKLFNKLFTSLEAQLKLTAAATPVAEQAAGAGALATSSQTSPVTTLNNAAAAAAGSAAPDMKELSLEQEAAMITKNIIANPSFIGNYKACQILREKAQTQGKNITELLVPNNTQNILISTYRRMREAFTTQPLDYEAEKNILHIFYFIQEVAREANLDHASEIEGALEDIPALNSDPFFHLLLGHINTLNHKFEDALPYYKNAIKLTSHTAQEPYYDAYLSVSLTLEKLEDAKVSDPLSLRYPDCVLPFSRLFSIVSSKTPAEIEQSSVLNAMQTEVMRFRKKFGVDDNDENEGNVFFSYACSPEHKSLAVYNLSCAILTDHKATAAYLERAKVLYAIGYPLEALHDLNYLLNPKIFTLDSETHAAVVNLRAEILTKLNPPNASLSSQSDVKSRAAAIVLPDPKPKATGFEAVAKKQAKISRIRIKPRKKVTSKNYSQGSGKSGAGDTDDSAVADVTAASAGAVAAVTAASAGAVADVTGANVTGVSAGVSVTPAGASATASITDDKIPLPPTKSEPAPPVPVFELSHVNEVKIASEVPPKPEPVLAQSPQATLASDPITPEATASADISKRTSPVTATPSDSKHLPSAHEEDTKLDFPKELVIAKMARSKFLIPNHLSAVQHSLTKDNKVFILGGSFVLNEVFYRVHGKSITVRDYDCKVDHSKKSALAAMKSAVTAHQMEIANAHYAPHGDLEYIKLTKFQKKSIDIIATSTPEDNYEHADFTIKTFKYDPVNNRLIYPSDDQALNDLFHRVVRPVPVSMLDEKTGIKSYRYHPATNFQNDPIRLLRAADLCTTIDGSIEEEAKKAIQANAHLLRLPAYAQRINMQLKKMIYSGKAVANFTLLKELGLLQQLFPGLKPHDEERLMNLLAEIDAHVANEVEKHLLPSFQSVYALLMACSVASALQTDPTSQGNLLATCWNHAHATNPLFKAELTYRGNQTKYAKALTRAIHARKDHSAADLKLEVVERESPSSSLSGSSVSSDLRSPVSGASLDIVSPIDARPLSAPHHETSTTLSDSKQPNRHRFFSPTLQPQPSMPAGQPAAPVPLTAQYQSSPATVSLQAFVQPLAIPGMQPLAPAPYSAGTVISHNGQVGVFFPFVQLTQAPVQSSEAPPYPQQMRPQF